MTDFNKMAESLMAGDRRALSRAITLVESSREDHRKSAVSLITLLEKKSKKQAIRIGLSGTPGVGKSTFIEVFGSYLTDFGLSVAVLAVDPSSVRSGGSILGDKTRMTLLARNPAAFIRPSPSQTHLGGVARRTRETVKICEVAGFDVILIETVGVGQSETIVSEICDIFTLLLAGVIAISIKMIGALLITGLLLIPAATARSLSSNPLQMVILSILVGIISVILGLFSSLELNTASGPSIIVAALVLFILSLISFKRSGALQR